MKFAKFNRRQSLLLITVWLTFMLSFVARLSWSTLMPIVNDALHFTVLQGTSYVTAFYIGYALMVLPGGLIADKIGYRKMIMFSLVAMAVVTGLMSTIHDYTTGFILRFILGLAAGPIQSSCLSAIGDYFNDHQRGTAVGLFMTCTSFGITVVNLYAPTVAFHYGWRVAFIITALLPLVVLALSFFTLKKSKTDTVQNVVQGAEQAAVKSTASTEPTKSVAQKLKILVRDRNVIMLAICGLFATGTTWGVTNWTNLYMVKHLGVSAIYAGSVMVVYGMAALISKPIIGILSDILPIRKNFLAAMAVFLMFPALLLFANTVNPSMLYVTGTLLGVGAFMYSAVTNALVIQVAHPDMRATTAGFVNMFNQIGALSAPMFLGGVLKATGNYSEALMIIAVFPLISCVALLFIKLKKLAA